MQARYVEPLGVPPHDNRARMFEWPDAAHPQGTGQTLLASFAADTN
jgi:hypothetical protein